MNQDLETEAVRHQVTARTNYGMFTACKLSLHRGAQVAESAYSCVAF